MSFSDINLHLVRGCSHSFPYFPYDFSIKTSQDALPAPEQSPAGEMDAHFTPEMAV